MKEEVQERDPTTSCCASSSTEGACSQELVDVNSLTQVHIIITTVINFTTMIVTGHNQRLELVTMELRPKYLA